MKGYYKLRGKALEILGTQLPDKLYYHSIEHTMEVLKHCNYRIKREKIPVREAKVLRLGALLHDIGFTVSNVNHEEKGSQIAEALMKEFGLGLKEIRLVQGLIMATRIPQSPKNRLERILCDSDLDYLGRADFYQVSDLLYKELKCYDMVHSKLEWNKIQIKFLESHRYHTDFSIRNRQPGKRKRIVELKNSVELPKKN